MVRSFLGGNVLWWTGPGPLGMTLSSYALRNERTVVWIDPVDPGADLQDVMALGTPEHILITFGDHDRDVLALAEQFGAQVWVPEGEAPAFKRPDHVFSDGADLPAGLKALALPGVGYGDSVLYGQVEGQRVGFFGDAILHLPLSGVAKLLSGLVVVHGDGPFQRKRSFRGGHTNEALRSIPRILSLDLDAAFFSHGEPVPHGAAEALRASITSW